MHLLRTNSSNTDFQLLVKALDEYLTITDGDEHAFYDQFNKITHIQHVVVIYNDEQPVACGAIKKYEDGVWELKRMYVVPEQRGSGIAAFLITELERWAKELGVKRLILETGKRQEAAVAFYHKVGYKVIENFGQYVGVENSICFEKQL
jgi:GNAT superfamily N-acetyltransferase